jgi:hypothetical protein
VYSKAELVAAQVRPNQSACHEPCTTTCTLPGRALHGWWLDSLYVEK